MPEKRRRGVAPASIALVLTLASLASAARAQPSGRVMPTARGTRWTYVWDDGREALVLEAVGSKQIDGRATTRIDQRGMSFFWSSQEVYLSATGDMLLHHGSSYGHHLIANEPPWVLVSEKLGRGSAWKSRSQYGGPGSNFAFEARVLDREKVSTPAGTFQAWKIEYVLTEHLGTEYDLWAWLAPGVGFVKIAQWRRSTAGRKEKLAAPIVCSLARLETGRPTAADLSGPPPTGSIDVVASAVSSTSPVGETLPVRFAIRNKSKGTIALLPSLDASDEGWRYPKIAIEVRDAQGALVDTSSGGRCGNMNPLEEGDFQILRPGETMDPFGAGSFGHHALRWAPTKAGTYTVKMRYDITFAGERPAPSTPLGKILESAPNGVYESKEVTITVR